MGWVTFDDVDRKIRIVAAWVQDKKKTITLYTFRLALKRKYHYFNS